MRRNTALWLSHVPFVRSFAAPCLARTSAFCGGLSVSDWKSRNSVSCQGAGAEALAKDAFLSYYDTKNLATKISCAVLASSEDIGARRLYTVMEYLLEEISFNASGDYPCVTLTIDRAYVDEHLAKLTGDRNLKKYVL